MWVLASGWLILDPFTDRAAGRKRGGAYNRPAMRGHSHYCRDGTESLRNIVRIVKRVQPRHAGELAGSERPDG